MCKLINTFFILYFILTPANAYLGPGVGSGVIAATVGIIVAIFAALFGLIWFPIKKLLKRNREKKQKNKVD